MPMVRNPVVAGQFYSSSRDELTKEIRALAGKGEEKKEEAIGVVSPHAGYMYSGQVAAATLSSIKDRSTYIIIGPNHTGLGEPFSMTASDSWKTPLGEIRINIPLAQNILTRCPQVCKDELAHIQEHSIEVQLPILQTLQKNFTIVPIVASTADIATYRKIGEGIALSIKDLDMEKDVTIIASSDMTHYESSEDARSKDSKAIDAILNLDEGALIKRIEEFGITMCGFVPAAIMLSASKKLGARRARLIKYMTSGDTTGDYSSVVGYAGIVIE